MNIFQAKNQKNKTKKNTHNNKKKTQNTTTHPYILMICCSMSCPKTTPGQVGDFCDTRNVEVEHLVYIGAFVKLMSILFWTA